MTQGALEIDATVLPAGERRTLWVRDGRISFEGQESSATLPPGGFVLSGLVDAHTHADYPQDALPDGGRPEFVRGNLRQFAQAGVLLLRDLGASSRTLEQLQRADGEPRVIPAGEALIGCANPCFPVTTPEQMRQHAVEQIRPGVQWVKIFTDWPDPSVEEEGKSQYFGEANPLTCPPEKLAELVAAVHEKGGRVASHVFTKLGAEASVAAGVDSIEHGWGIDESLFPSMLEKNIAWVPLVAIAAPMLEIATRDGRPDQHTWIEACRARLRRTLPAAVKAGVVLLTGTDWFPMISVADEINTLVQLGVPPSAALDAASSGARRYFGHSGLEEGAAADLVWYRRDPRGNLPAVPDQILLDGAPVTPIRPQNPTPPSAEKTIHLAPGAH